MSRLRRVRGYADLIPHAAVILGWVMVSVGFGLLLLPLGLIVGGLSLVVGALLYASGQE